MPRNPLKLRSIIALAALAQLSRPVAADVIVLKNGERLNAKIIKTTETTVEVDVKISSGVTDSRIIPTSEIAEIEKPDPAEEAFDALKEFGPGPNSLTSALYNAAIYTHLTPFLNKYPKSPRAGEVKQLIAALEQEKTRVADGDIKVENEWYTPAELEKQKTQVSATLLYQQMRMLGQSGDRIAALNLFGQIEKLHSGCRAYPLAVEYALQLIPGVQREIEAKKIVLRNDLAERQKGMSLVPPHQQAPLIAAAASDDAKIEASIAAAQKAGNKWTPIYPRSVKSIEVLQGVTTAEAARLASIQTTPMLASIANAQQAKEQLAAGDLETATATLQKASSLWAGNLMVKDLTDALNAAKATPSQEPLASPSPSAKPQSVSAVSPASSTVPVPKVSPSIEPSVPPASPTFVAPAPSPVPTLPKTTAAGTVAPEKKGSFLTTIPGAATILGIAAIIAGGISWSLKAKQKSFSERP